VLHVLTGSPLCNRLQHIYVQIAHEIEFSDRQVEKYQATITTVRTYCYDLECLQTGFGLVNGFFDHIKITVADFHIVFSVCFHESLLGNSSPQWLFLCSVFTRRFLVTNINSGDS
jgi:hypothetical protein